MWNALHAPCDLAITMPYALEPTSPSRPAFAASAASRSTVPWRACGYHRENRAYRDAGRLLADVRETAVLPATVAGLVERYDGVLNPEPLRPLVDALDARHAATIADALGNGGVWTGPSP